MGFDIKAAVDGIAAVVSQNYPYLLAGFVLLLLFSSNRVRDGIHKALTENWQLTLLASTGIALSLASAYTTFDGLRNFTSAPLLSIFISFGIQGVMLIVAWLIGESFATGMSQQTSDGLLHGKGGDWEFLGGVPKAIVSRMEAAVAEALAKPDVKTRLNAAGFTPVAAPATAFADLIARDLVKWSRVVKEAGLTAD